MTLRVGIAAFGASLRDSTVERLCRDSRLFRMDEGTTEIQHLIIGRELMNRAAA